MRINGKDYPNPGSEAARDEGCTCPTLDNNRGELSPFGDDDLWWVTEDCPVHFTPMMFSDE